MLYELKRFKGILFGLGFCLFTAFDGVCRIINPGHITGDYNYLIATFLLAFLCIFLFISYLKTISEIKNKNTFYLCLALFGFIFFSAIFNILSSGSLKYYLLDVIYILLFFITYIFLKVFIFYDDTVKKSFFGTVVFLIGLILPLTAWFLGFFDVQGRFQGIYGASSFSGNIAAVIFGYLVINPLNLKSSLKNPIILCFCIFVIFISGTRTGMLIAIGSMYINIMLNSFNYRKLYKNILTCILLVFTCYALYVVYQTINVYSSDEFRIFSINDLKEAGSLSTRINWAIQLISEIANDDFIGGFGSNGARSLLGFIPHSDVLKTYYDYSIFSALSLIGVFLACAKTNYRYTWIYNISVLMLLTFHNLLYSPILFVSIMPFIMSMKVTRHG